MPVTARLKSKERTLPETGLLAALRRFSTVPLPPAVPLMCHCTAKSRVRSGPTYPTGSGSCCWPCSTWPPSSSSPSTACSASTTVASPSRTLTQSAFPCPTCYSTPAPCLHWSSQHTSSSSPHHCPRRGKGDARGGGREDSEETEEAAESKERGESEEGEEGAGEQRAGDTSCTWRCWDW